MQAVTSFTYTINNTNDKISKEIKYNDYSKNDDGDEHMLSYKNVFNDNESIESFNKIHRDNHMMKEMVGNSVNKNKWKIQEYNNSHLQKQYDEEYNKLKFNINTDILENIYNQNKYIKDKIE
jgi:hypothetical protein